MVSTFDAAKSMDIVTLASPSAARIWAEKMGTDFVAVTIGPTSHKAAEGLGYKIVRSPAVGSKGVEAWADTVKAVAAELETNMKSANTHA
jgi:uroporphyrinogen-III synthase